MDTNLQQPRPAVSFAVTTVSNSVSVNGSTNISTTQTHTKAGWLPLGVVGTYTGNPNVLCYGCRISSTGDGSATLTIQLRNYSSSSISAALQTDVMWTLLEG